ncbi:MAG: hypothetical protein ACK2UA_05805, partial [Anaerolineae bacterium]
TAPKCLLHISTGQHRIDLVGVDELVAIPALLVVEIDHWIPPNEKAQHGGWAWVRCLYKLLRAPQRRFWQKG